jgi:hypothetical protein
VSFRLTKRNNDESVIHNWNEESQNCDKKELALSKFQSFEAMKYLTIGIFLLRWLNKLEREFVGGGFDVESDLGNILKLCLLKLVNNYPLNIQEIIEIEPLRFIFARLQAVIPLKYTSTSNLMPQVEGGMGMNASVIIESI